VDWNAQYQVVIIWPNGTTEPSISNVIAQVQQTPAGGNGFTIPAGTKLGYIEDSPPADPGDATMVFFIEGSNGDVAGQVADAQNILSQAKYLDPATVAAAINLVNTLTTLQAPTMKDCVVWNSPNGGSVYVYPGAQDMFKGNCEIGVEVFPVHMPPSKSNGYTIE
jgi:hypothetical protein